MGEVFPQMGWEPIGPVRVGALALLGVGSTGCWGWRSGQAPGRGLLVVGVLLDEGS